MGDYTELNLGVKLRGNTPKYIIETITLLIEGDAFVLEDLPVAVRQEPLFAEPSYWQFMLINCSYYFDGQPCHVWKYDEIANGWFLTLRANTKNYSEEWTRFLQFIVPFVESKGFVGTHWYEYDVAPKLIFMRAGKFEFISLPTQMIQDLDHRYEPGVID
ncbi:MAG: hypothetical protein H6818_00050 [Phycisphaerales bacterium]|nr:hypothetical protein [Phycisphaerales bacterium]MCB9864357.1 hypothetical protein [Phycisphaerales bacterium]